MSPLLRSARASLLMTLGCGLLSLSGCANMVETRAITAFTQALQEHDAQKAREIASDRFEQKALRLDESIDDFAVLRLPKGEVNIVSVDDVNSNEKRVTVEIGERKERVKYRLTRESSSKKWVVDDIQIRQKKGNVVATRSVSELMDLVTSVREFLKAWDRGVRADMIELATPELGEVLGKLPPAYVASLAKQAVGDRAQESKIKPEAQIDDDAAVVRLPRKAGQMLISFRKQNDQWLIHDLAVENKSEKDKHIPSVRQMAIALHAAVEFLDAYNAGDKARLKAISRASFYNGSLDSSDLNLAPLPTASAAVDSYQLRLDSGLADFVINQSHQVVSLNMQKVEGKDSQTANQYQVSEVSIYDLEDTQEKRLSSLFMSREIVDEFAAAFTQRNLDMLLLLASPDFKRRVWNKVDAALLQQLPLLEVEAVEPHVLTTVFSGSVTEITVRQGSRALTYVLLDKQGQLFVDDILMPTAGRPNSLKQTLDILVSVKQFENALTDEDLSGLQQSSSRELNRLVWHVADRVPNVGFNPLAHFDQPLVKLDVDDEKATACLGDDRFGARISLVKEADRYVVDDVLIIQGLEAKHRTAMRDTMRLEISRFRGGRNTTREIVPASASSDDVTP